MRISYQTNSAEKRGRVPVPRSHVVRVYRQERRFRLTWFDNPLVDHLRSCMRSDAVVLSKYVAWPRDVSEEGATGAINDVSELLACLDVSMHPQGKDKDLQRILFPSYDPVCQSEMIELPTPYLRCA